MDFVDHGGMICLDVLINVAIPMAETAVASRNAKWVAATAGAGTDLDYVGVSNRGIQQKKCVQMYHKITLLIQGILKMRECLALSFPHFWRFQFLHL